ncbi:hypothetical protein [Devosia riboflavina]
MARRTTWRRSFASAPAAATQDLGTWAAAKSDLTLIDAPAEISVISSLNERTSLAFYRNAPYRRELVSWMRLSPSDPRFGIDGLSAPSMGMSRFEAIGAGIVLSDAGFNILDSVGLVAPLISEKSRTSSASAVLLFHRSLEGKPDCYRPSALSASTRSCPPSVSRPGPCRSWPMTPRLRPRSGSATGFPMIVA